MHSYYFTYTHRYVCYASINVKPHYHIHRLMVEEDWNDKEVIPPRNGELLLLVDSPVYTISSFILILGINL